MDHKKVVSAENLTDVKLPPFNPWGELSVLAVLIMQLSWIVPWYQSLTMATSRTSSLLPFSVLGSIFVLTYISTRALDILNFTTQVSRTVSVGILILAILISLQVLMYPQGDVSFTEAINLSLDRLADVRVLIPDELVVIGVVLIIWRSGVVFGGRGLGSRGVIGQLSLGIVMFTIFGFFNSMITGETPGTFLFLFLFSSLIAKGAARVSLISRLRGGTISPFDRSWLMGFILSALIVVAVAGGIGILLAGNVGELAFKGLITVISGIVMILLYPIAYIVLLFGEWLRSSLPAPEIPEPVETVIPLGPETLDPGTLPIEEIMAIPAWIQYVKPTIIFGFIILVVFIVLRQVRKAQERRMQKAPFESIYEIGNFFEALKAAFEGSGMTVLERINAVRLRYVDRIKAAERIRIIYAKLLDLCYDLDIPRKESQTPLEFLPVIEMVLHTRERELFVITNAYIRVRYGEYPETKNEVQEVEDAWDSVLTHGTNLLSERKKKSKGRS
jgi:hypothetical protein